MTELEKMKLRTKLRSILLVGCETNSEFFKRLLVAQQVITECLTDFRDDFDEKDPFGVPEDYNEGWQ